MLKDVTSVTVLEGYRLHLQFEDGAEGDIDVSELVPFTGVFAPLKDRMAFLGVRVDPELGTVVWPNGADLDPAVLYSRITGASLPGTDRGHHA